MIKKLIILFLLASVCYGRFEPSNLVYKERIADCNIYVGNRKTEDFEAHVKFAFWDEDESLSFYAPGVKGQPVVTDRITLDNFQWYVEGDDLKWIVTYDTKPPTNSYSFIIDGWEDYEFNYQTPFAEEIPSNKREYFTKDGEEWIRSIWPNGLVDERPVSIEGSYAVRHKTKRNHTIGDTNYTTGKVLHIPRPKATDSNGSSVWCEIRIEDGVYTSTVPQKFLDEAVYPVTINDTLGHTDIGSGNTNNFNNDMVVCAGPWTATEDGTVTSCSWYMKGLSSTPVTLGFYDDDGGGDPEDNQGDSDGGVEEGDEFVTQDVSGSISNGIDYHIAFNSDEDTPDLKYDSGTHQISWDAQVYVAGTLTATIGDVDGSIANRDYSAYLTYTPAGGAAGQVIFITTY